MKLKSKIIKLTVIIPALLLMLSGCTKNDVSKDGTTIVCTIFPIYDWVCEMTDGAENINVILLCDNGADMHSFQPSVQDMMMIADSDVFIYVGGESDEWIEDCLSQNANAGRDEINLMEVLSNDTLEESDEGILEENHEEEEETDYDEHVWMSLKRSIKCIEAIEGVIEGKADEKTASLIANNTKAYTDKLTTLDEEYSDYFASVENPMIIVADRFPFRYLVEDYGISYYAAFSGCSTETDASFETIIELGKNLASSGKRTVYITEGGDEVLAKTVIEQAGIDANILVLDSIQTDNPNVLKETNTGYFDIMKANLEVLKSGQ